MLVTLHFNRCSQRGKRKALRRNASDAEQRLWQRLRGKPLGTKCRRQYSVDANIEGVLSTIEAAVKRCSSTSGLPLGKEGERCGIRHRNSDKRY